MVADPADREHRMGLVEQRHQLGGHDELQTAQSQLLAENAAFIATARVNRTRHVRTLREADRRIRDGLAAIRRATLRVVSN